MTRSNLDAAQIAKDAEVARLVYKEELAELEKEKEKRQREEEASNAAIAEMYDEVQAGIEANALFAAKLQQEERKEYTIKERAKFLAETIATQRKFIDAQRSAEIRSRPPNKSQLRNLMMTYLKNMAWLKSVQRLSMKKRFRKKESVSKQGRKKDKPKPTLDDSTLDDLDVDHGMDTEEPMNDGRLSEKTEELVSTARPEDSTVRPDVGTADPIVPPTTTTNIFDDEDVTMAQTLIKMKEEKAKEKGVSIKDIEYSSRPARSILTLKPLPTIDQLG
nr:hypothetical protein [Tanacetum cinerariifolium]